MGDLLLLAFYAAAPIAYVLLVRSTARMVLAVSFIVATIGGLLQLSTSQGYSWSLVTIQWVLAGALAVLVGAGALWRVRNSAGMSGRSLAAQLQGVWVPAAAIVLFLAAMRFLAAEQPSVLSGVAFLINHGAAEDNAKWLNLSSQLAVGDQLTFVGGYAGGALIVVMAVAATAARAVSQLAYGGVNELGVTVQAVIGASYLLIAAAPLALAPLVERRFPPKPSESPRRWLPAPTIWAGALVLASGSAALTFFGHLSLQLVLLMLTIWATAFLAKAPGPRGWLMATALAVSAGVVWFPLNLLSLAALAALVAVLIATTVRRLRAGQRPDGLAWLLGALTVISAWDGLISSTLYALGIGSGSGDVSASGAIRGASVPADTASLFSSPGGTQIASSALVVLAALSAIGAAWLIGQGRMGSRDLAIRFAPIGAIAGYALLIGMADGILTASGENYPTQKMAFGATIIIAAATVPLAVGALSHRARGMTLVRWVAVGAVAFLLAADSLLPRAIAMVGPQVWAQATEGTPYWSTFEVQAKADQPIAQLPIACAFLPAGAEVPNGNINGPLSYTCTRILIGLNGRDGRAGSVRDWIIADWLSNGTFWNDWAPLLAGAPEDIINKKVILLGRDGNVIGFDTLSGLLAKYPPPAN